MATIIRYWGRIEAWLMGVLAAMALALICFEVATRYFAPTYLPDWGSEFVIYFVVWAIFIAGSSLVEEGRHVRADIIIRLLSPVWQRVLELVSCAAGLLFCAVVAWYGLEVVTFAYDLEEVSESSMQFPLYLYYAGMPLGFGMMVIRYIIRIYRYLFKFDAATMVISDEEVLRDK